MPRREPEFYEPSSAEETRVFDGADEDLDEDGSRLPLLLVVALIMVFAFGAVVWFAYTQGVQSGRSGAPRVIAAQPGPVRTAPAHPGGVTPYQGLKIYDQPASGTASSPPPQTTRGGQAAPPALSQATAKPQVITKLVPKPVTKPAMPPQAAPLASQHAASVVRHAQVAGSAPHAPGPKAGAATLAPHTMTAGPWMLQIGAYKSRAEAQAAWRIYSHRHPAASGLAPAILRVDLGTKGIWYRLRIGSYASRSDAARACSRLKASGAACFPAKG
ncbi:MAG: SPOR domain-containing protein [Alphaproteobacteria bacterium]|nr:SPOR domain-containing protein [Alphaproteobacteria bacterium]